MKVPLEPGAAKALTFQEYGPAPEVEGVFLHQLRKHRSLEGWFMEQFRLTGGKVQGLPIDFEVRQVSIAHAVPGRINAFHLHPRAVQDELWCVVRGSLLIWLVDVRAASPSKGAQRPIVLSAEQPALLHIPSGVAHGYRAGPEGALLVYAMNAQFDPDHPNEGRLPWDHFGAGLWESDRG